MEYVEYKQARSTLRILGISASQLVALFVILLSILLLLFLFIILGVHAFTANGAGVFGSLINSVFPIGAGVAVAQ